MKTLKIIFDDGREMYFSRFQIGCLPDIQKIKSIELNNEPTMYNITGFLDNGGFGGGESGDIFEILSKLEYYCKKFHLVKIEKT